ncbi:hypothetical protein [Arthrobacter sp. 2MCAF14]|uniref:hypothetical protein n=1 Tax=Arthrobacter sp. 2MCAF14 TaxID=3232982 RepID=UPI003F8DB061
MNQWLADNIWFGVALSVAGIIAGFYVPRWTRRKVNPAWQLRSQTPLLAVGMDGSALKLLHGEGEEAKHPFLNVIRFGNRGKEEILGRDFDGAVTVSFSKAKLIGAAIHDALGLGTTVELEHKGNSVTFTPALLRKDEWVELQLVTDGAAEVPALQARLADQRAEMVEMSYKRRDFWAFSQFMTGFGFFAFMLLYPFMPSTTQGFGAFGWLVCLIWFFVASRQKSKSPTWKKEPKVYGRF